MKTTWVINGTRAVAISVDGDAVTAVKYVGVTNAADPSSCPDSVPTLRWSGKTEAGARKWAAKVLN